MIEVHVNPDYISVELLHASEDTCAKESGLQLNKETAAFVLALAYFNI
jgi:hypothetical protein